MSIPFNSRQYTLQNITIHKISLNKKYNAATVGSAVVKRLTNIY